MPLNRFVPILLGVALAAALTIGVSALVADRAGVPSIWPWLAPLAMGAALLVRILARRGGGRRRG